MRQSLDIRQTFKERTEQTKAKLRELKKESKSENSTKDTSQPKK